MRRFAEVMAFLLPRPGGAEDGARSLWGGRTFLLIGGNQWKIWYGMR